MSTRIDIFGTCCSREIINYTEDIDINCYIFQNPIMTAFCKALKLENQEDIIANSNFAKRMVNYEFNKHAIGVLKKHP